VQQQQAPRGSATSLVPESLRFLAADPSSEAAVALQRLKRDGQAELTRQEAARRRRALTGVGVDSFAQVLSSAGCSPTLRHGQADTLQVNLGLYCNQACNHCHVESSPLRVKENMDSGTLDRVLAVLAASCTSAGGSVHTLDLTGGAPELNPHFRRAVVAAVGLGVTVIDRCNLTVLCEPGQEDLASFLAAHRVRVVASLPCYNEDTVDKQRGAGVYERSIAGLKQLNAVGYGMPGTGLMLDLMYNPAGPSLPPAASTLEAAYKRELGSRHGIVFNNLLTLTNMPIKRFADRLHQDGATEAYMRLLHGAFNPATVAGVMCTRLVSVRWDGALFDCDFNQQLDIQPGAPKRTIWEIASTADWDGCAIATDLHCLGCTAGAGSSCTGAVA
jgi:radical SAM/Cys-rich protein